MDYDYDYDRERYGRYGTYGEPTWRGREFEQERPMYGQRYYGYGRYGYEREPRWRGSEYGREPFSGGRYGTVGERWTTEGPYAGRGPRGYTRSDERICEDVCMRLTAHGQIDAGDMEVTVTNSEVTLTGTARSRWEKRMAEDVAESVPGVRDVHNQLRVQPEIWGAPAISAGTFDRSRLQIGMEVVGSDANGVGQIKEVRLSDFLLDRPIQRDVYVPFDAIQDVTGNRTTLNIPADQVDNMGWANPAITGEPTTGG